MGLRLLAFGDSFVNGTGDPEHLGWVGRATAGRRAVSRPDGRAAAGAPYIDVFARLLAEPVWAEEVAAGDGAHPGAAGYAALARIVASEPDWDRFLAV